MAFLSFIVEPAWLHEALKSNDQQIRLVDATWLMPDAEKTADKQCLEGACFFDLDAIAAPHDNLKHMLPSARQFEDFNRAHGIGNADHVICYDRSGVFSSPRLWWTYRMFGHEHVSVLNGGLSAWATMGFHLSDGYDTSFAKSDYKAGAPLSGVIGFKELKSHLHGKTQIVDARPEGRFLGTSPEPRPGLRSGHMPGAISLPFSALKNSAGFEDMTDIAQTVGESGINLSAPIITTCGSGITAAGLTLIFHQLGAKHVRVYDGSWAEWGASNAPIET